MTERWIAWQLHHLDGASVFSKYCRPPGALWVTCGASDADDVAPALWQELLFRTAGPDGLPPEWQQSADDATVALRALRDALTGVYVVSAALPVSLFMDNIEVANAFDAVGRSQGLMPSFSAGGALAACDIMRRGDR